jgi:hypothetical protein
MHYDRMLPEVFQQLCAYPFPFGSANMQWVADASDDTLRRLSTPRLRDQAVSIFGVFEQCKGEYCALWRVAQHQGMTPYLDEEMAKKAHSLVWIQGLGRRVRALLDAAPRRAGAHGLDRHRRCWGGLATRQRITASSAGTPSRGSRPNNMRSSMRNGIKSFANWVENLSIVSLKPRAAFE